MDFIMVNREGIRLLALGKQHKRVVKSASGQEKMIHSL
jgi:hypothetical protein